MMTPPKKSPEEKLGDFVKFRIPEPWHKALEEERKESDGVIPSKVHIIRSLIYKHIKPRLDKKKR